MAMTSILILTTIVAAFVLFGIVLAWGEYQTRHFVYDRKQGRERDGFWQYARASISPEVQSSRQSLGEQSHQSGLIGSPYGCARQVGRLFFTRTG
jgi:lipopolysaccharide export LptBFGC system permease protein LptF